MINSKDLTDEQLAAIKTWAEEGAQLPDIQKRLTGEFGLSVTYMDTRFLILDLGIELQTEAEEEETVVESESDEGAVPLADATPAAAGGVRVTMDEVFRAGAMVSGAVTFSDGVTGKWFIDQMGALELETVPVDYKPGEADITAFESELRRLLDQ